MSVHISNHNKRSVGQHLVVFVVIVVLVTSILTIWLLKWPTATVLITGVLLVLLFLFNIPGLSWILLREQEAVVIVTLNRRTEECGTGFLINIKWPFQRARKYSLAPTIVEMDTMALAVGGDTAGALVIHDPGFEFQVVDPGKTYWNTPSRDPIQAFATVFGDALTRVLSGTTFDRIKAEGTEFLVRCVTDALHKEAANWGCKVRRVWLKDVDIPNHIQAAAAEIALAKAKAAAIQILSEAENTAYVQEKSTQGEDYIGKQVMDTLAEMAGKGALHTVIGDIPFLGKLLNGKGH